MTDHAEAEAADDRGARPPRLGVLPPSEWTDAERELHAFWGEPNAWEEGSRNNVSLALVHHPAMGMAYYTFGRHILLNNTLPPRTLELLVLRVAWKVKSVYEWHNHVGYGIKAGLTMEEIAAVRDFPAGGEWSAPDRCLLAAIDELMDTGRLSDETWDALRAIFSKRQVMDFVMSVGSYVMTSWALSAFEVQLEGGADPIGFDLQRASGRGLKASEKPGATENWVSTRGY